MMTWGVLTLTAALYDRTELREEDFSTVVSIDLYFCLEHRVLVTELRDEN